MPSRRVFGGTKPPEGRSCFCGKEATEGRSSFWENEAKPTRWILVLGERSEANEVAPGFGRTKRSQRGGSWFWENEAKPTRWILVLGERSEANEVAPGFGRTKRSQRGGSWFWENKAKPKRAGSWFWPNKPTGRNRAWGGPYLIASGLRSRQASAISESLLRLHRARAVPSPASHVCPRLLPMQTTAPTEKTLLL
jgi:hypothetical protein